MRFQRRSSRLLRTALVAALSALFFLLAMGITLMGSSVYRSTAAASDAHYTSRTAVSYLANQLRQGDRADSITVTSFGDGDALMLSDGTYYTLLYCYEGELRELYAETGSGMTPADGISILSLETMEISVQDGLISLHLTGEDAGGSVSYAPRCGVSVLEEVNP